MAWPTNPRGLADRLFAVRGAIGKQFFLTSVYGAYGLPANHVQGRHCDEYANELDDTELKLETDKVQHVADLFEGMVVHLQALGTRVRELRAKKASLEEELSRVNKELEQAPREREAFLQAMKTETGRQRYSRHSQQTGAS
jgi:predicted RNase H-like nuclease (RuvC/YqgF family)